MTHRWRFIHCRGKKKGKVKIQIQVRTSVDIHGRLAQPRTRQLIKIENHKPGRVIRGSMDNIISGHHSRPAENLSFF